MSVHILPQQTQVRVLARAAAAYFITAKYTRVAVRAAANFASYMKIKDIDNGHF